jgi:hypothetical protein
MEKKNILFIEKGQIMKKERKFKMVNNSTNINKMNNNLLP